MINFFRRIRQKLLSKNRLGKYLLYAIGEIVLVVIGILIALQINNASEQRKEVRAQRDYLSGIKQDLMQDLLFFDARIPVTERRLAHYRKIDTTTVNFTNIEQRTVGDTLVDLKYFVVPVRSFRPKIGSYNSMISEGRSGIITNRELFGQIQEVYEVYTTQLQDCNAYIDVKSKEVMWEHRDLLMINSPRLSPAEIKDHELIASLNYLQYEVARSVRLSKRLVNQINVVIEQIENELKIL